jgi:hypothetical protein
MRNALPISLRSGRFYCVQAATIRQMARSRLRSAASTVGALAHFQTAIRNAVRIVSTKASRVIARAMMCSGMVSSQASEGPLRQMRITLFGSK